MNYKERVKLILIFVYLKNLGINSMQNVQGQYEEKKFYY